MGRSFSFKALSKMKIISKFKSLSKYILYNILDSLITLQKKEFKIKQNTKNILLIRLDAIGDYILFRNFIEILKKEPKYSEYKITLIGNIIWKELAETLDKEYISEFVWIDTKKFHRDIIYRYKILKKVYSTYYDVVIHPTYSRTYDADNIVKISNANEKIGSIGDLSNISKWQKKTTDKYYTRLIPAQKNIMFEFYRNKEFFENLMNKKLDITKPYIKLPTNYTFNFELPKSDYAVLFIGASANFRKWSIENFGEVAKWIKCNLGYEIVLCGGKEDIESIKIFEKVYNDTYLNLVGKTNLIDLLFIIKNSKIIISNETFFPHMAVALNAKNIFVISNGNHFGRFIPYPREITENYFPIYHPEIEKNLEHYKKLSNVYGYRSQLDINEITPQQVIRKIIDNMEDKHDR
jgi:ADP-heptose:LPS heptosyltransferase